MTINYAKRKYIVQNNVYLSGAENWILWALWKVSNSLNYFHIVLYKSKTFRKQWIFSYVANIRIMCLLCMKSQQQHKNWLLLCLWSATKWVDDVVYKNYLNIQYSMKLVLLMLLKIFVAEKFWHFWFL